MNESIVNFRTLTPMERRIYFDIVRYGFSNKAIGCNQGIALSTVKSHVRHMFNKMLVDTREQLIIDYYNNVKECNS